VAIDGKALCGTRETGKKTLVHMVSAWAEGNGLVLAQRKVDDKSNEWGSCLSTVGSTGSVY
jgi:hypothetical protein